MSVLHAIDTVATTLHLSYFLVGAMARDILLGHVFGLHPGRATRDVDVALALDGGEQFQQIKDRLLAGRRFTIVRDIVHRVLFSPDGITPRCMVDLLPFGGIEQPRHIIAWPPDMEMLMRVAGYSDAFNTALLVHVEPGLAIRVASLPGLALLKLFAWQERGQADARDALDLVTLCRHYADAGNLDRLYEEEVPILQAVGFDVELAGAWLLGLDTAATASQESRIQLQALLSDAHASARLVNDMAKALRRREDALTYAEQLLDQFHRGFSAQAEA